MLRGLATVALTVLAIGCAKTSAPAAAAAAAGAGPVADSGTVTDSGTVIDAGSVTDSATGSEIDAGTVTDAGSATDSATGSELDAGNATDAGSVCVARAGTNTLGTADPAFEEAVWRAWRACFDQLGYTFCDMARVDLGARGCVTDVAAVAGNEPGPPQWAYVDCLSVELEGACSRCEAEEGLRFYRSCTE